MSAGRVVLGVFGGLFAIGVAGNVLKGGNSSTTTPSVAALAQESSVGKQPATPVEKPFTAEACTSGIERMNVLLKDRAVIDGKKACANFTELSSDARLELTCAAAATGLTDLARCSEGLAKMVWKVDASAVPDGILTRLIFGKSTVKTSMGFTTVLVEASNPTTSSLSCTVSATLKRGGEILAVANGAVNDVPAKGKRTAQLMTADSIKGYDKIEVDADTCFGGEEVSTTVGAAGSASDARLTFGKPTLRSQMGFTTVLVEARNTTDAELSCTVSATFKKGGTIMTTANGAVNEIPAGGKRTAQLMTADPVKGYDELILSPDACF